MDFAPHEEMMDEKINDQHEEMSDQEMSDEDHALSNDFDDMENDDDIQNRPKLGCNCVAFMFDMNSTV